MREPLHGAPFFPATRPDLPPVPTRILVRFTLREAAGTLMLGAVLFLTAGRVDWWPAWALMGLTAAWAVATGLAVVRTRPDLLAERIGRRDDTPRWDRVLMSAAGTLTLLRLAVAGLDQRYGWSGHVAVETQLLGVALCGLGYALAVWAVSANAWFTDSVRLQPERAQVVATGGPYALMRHPGYLGAMLAELGAPLLLGSWWALVPAVSIVALFLARTAKEDALLRANLVGYADYARRTKDRLIPGLW